MKSVFKSLGNNSLKVGKFAGKKLKAGAIYLYDHSDEIISKAQVTADKAKQRHQNEIDSYKRSLSGVSNNELENVVRNSDEPDNKRRAAKELLES